MPDQQFSNGAVRMPYRSQYTFTQVARRVAVTQFERLSGSRARTRGGAGGPYAVIIECDFGHHGGVPARVKHFKSAHIDDLTHTDTPRFLQIQETASPGCTLTRSSTALTCFRNGSS